MRIVCGGFIPACLHVTRIAKITSIVHVRFVERYCAERTQFGFRWTASCEKRGAETVPILGVLGVEVNGIAQAGFRLSEIQSGAGGYGRVIPRSWFLRRHPQQRYRRG